MSVTHLLWAPSLFVGSVLAAANAAGGSGNGEVIAAILGGVAAIISAVTGLIVALSRRNTQIIVVDPEEAADLHLTKPRRRRA